MKKRIQPRKKTRLKEKQRRARVARISLFVILFVTIIFGLSYLSRSDWAKIDYVRVSGNSLVPSEDIRKIIEQGGATPFLGVFSSDNFILYPKQKVEKSITDRFKSIKKVDITFGSGNTIGVKVVEREPSYIWCATETSPADECFYMDESGYIFGKSPNFSGNILLKYYGFFEVKEAVGKTFLSVARLKDLRGFVDSVKALGTTPVGVLAHTESDFELFLSPSGRVIFNDKADFIKTAENLGAIAREHDKKAGKGDFFSKLEYVDLRFGFKAFFKLK